MMHPDTELRYVNPTIGYGVYATRVIPRGTLVYVEDPLEIRIAAEHELLKNPDFAPIIQKFSFVEPDGTFVISWDLAKHVNHCCHYNAVGSAYGFEIAVRDIQPEEEITDDYASYTFEETMELACHYPDCRKILRPGDFDRYVDQWDAEIKEALKYFSSVPQPLLKYMESEDRKALLDYVTTGENYRSMKSMKYAPPT
ncbi:MAG: SET domain-containing protein [Anaerolineales bacterium]|nr:MAG: SET domain-containing protein [Anaerolineales bacterium]